MSFDLDAFESGDVSMDRAVTQAARKLLRRGYGVASVEVTVPTEDGFPWGWSSKGVRSVRTWSIAVSGAPGLPDFQGVLAIRQTTMTYSSSDSRDVRETPVSTWCEYIPDTAGTAKVLKANDGY